MITPEYIVGDLNGDGKVTAANARTSLRISAKLDIPTDVQLLAADIDKNGKVTSAEVRQILRVSSKLENF